MEDHDEISMCGTVERLGLRSSTKAKENKKGRRRLEVGSDDPFSGWSLSCGTRGENSVACGSYRSTVVLSSNTPRPQTCINCERGVASVANYAYPLRYLASRFSLRSRAINTSGPWASDTGVTLVSHLSLPVGLPLLLDCTSQGTTKTISEESV